MLTGATVSSQDSVRLSLDSFYLTDHSETEAQHQALVLSGTIGFSPKYPHASLPHFCPLSAGRSLSQRGFWVALYNTPSAYFPQSAHYLICIHFFLCVSLPWVDKFHKGKFLCPVLLQLLEQDLGFSRYTVTAE